MYFAQMRKMIRLHCHDEKKDLLRVYEATHIRGRCGKWSVNLSHQFPKS